MLLHRGLLHIGRVRQILHVLVVKYGLGYVVELMGLSRLVPSRAWFIRTPRKVTALSLPERLRRAFGELGPSFIKVGQLLGSRADLVPPAYVVEFRKLQDAVPPVAFDQIEPLLRSELGRPLLECFATFDPVPLAAASIGQVHAATLPDGTEVTVKVQRPGIEQIINTDLAILADAAALLDHRVPALRRYDLPALVREFDAVIREELSYPLEGKRTEQIRRNLAAFPGVTAPRVFWDLTRPRVLTIERFRGSKLDDPEALRRRGHDPREIAARLGHAVLHQVFIDGLFHADPHYGNLLITDDGLLVFLDFGIVGRLDLPARRGLADLGLAIHHDDVPGLIRALCEIGIPGEEADLLSLRTELRRLLDRYRDVPGRGFRLGAMLNDMVARFFHHDIRLPWEFSLVSKSLLVAEGVASELDPAFDFAAISQPVIDALVAERRSPRYLAEVLWLDLREAQRQLCMLPSRLDRVFTRLERGTLRLRIEDPQADRRTGRLVISSNRLSISVFAAAMLLCSTWLLTQPRVPFFLWLGIGAGVVGLFSGLLLLLGILRSGGV